MSRNGLWSCEACAREHDLPWGEQASAPKGWCSMSQHRVQTRLEWMLDVEPAIHVSDYVFPDRARETSATAANPAFAEAVKADHSSAPAPRPGPYDLPTKQLELF